jgi:hypothetical protein
LIQNITCKIILSGKGDRARTKSAKRFVAELKKDKRKLQNESILFNIIAGTYFSSCSRPRKTRKNMKALLPKRLRI